jgi:hypothetical protein
MHFLKDVKYSQDSKRCPIPGKFPSASRPPRPWVNVLLPAPVAPTIAMMGSVSQGDGEDIQRKRRYSMPITAAITAMTAQPPRRSRRVRCVGFRCVPWWPANGPSGLDSRWSPGMSSECPICLPVGLVAFVPGILPSGVSVPDGIFIFVESRKV